MARRSFSVTAVMDILIELNKLLNCNLKEIFELTFGKDVRN
jgi:hypothetical protein